jgi:hypothetical protein
MVSKAHAKSVGFVRAIQEQDIRVLLPKGNSFWVDKG